MTKRKRTKFAGLDKSVNLKIRHELLDFDYLNKLNDKEKEFLSNFMREWASADFNHPGKRINKSKKSVKAIYDANNARNRDAFAVTKSNGMLKGMSGADLGKEDNNRRNSASKNPGMSGSKSTVMNEVEDTLITVLDYLNEENDI